MLPIFILDRTEERRDDRGFHPTRHIVLKRDEAASRVLDGDLNLSAFTEGIGFVLIGRVVRDTTADAEGVAIIEGVLYATLLRDSDCVVHVYIIPFGVGDCKHFLREI